MQARQAPAIEFVQQLLKDGYLGEVMSTTILGLSVPGDIVVQANAYMLDETNGANALTIGVGHSLDTLNHVRGEFDNLSAVTDLRRPLITIEETGQQIAKTAADQIAVIGTLTSGQPSASMSAKRQPAVPASSGKSTEPAGRSGSLQTPPTPKSLPLTVVGARVRNRLHELAVPAAFTQKWPSLSGVEGTPAYNVGRAYARFAEDIQDGTHMVPDFADALRRHEVIASIERSAASGERVKP